MRSLRRLYDFNKVNKDILALTSINDVDGRFISKAKRFWWAYRIAMEFHLNPHDVKHWDPDDVMETLAAIGLIDKNTPKPQN